MTTMSSARRQAASFAATVSRVIRRGGIQTLGSGTSRMREGVRVTGHGPSKARVHVDLDAPSAALRLTDDVVAVLHEAGYRTERTDDNGLYVHKGGTAATSTDTRPEAQQ